MQPHLEGDLSQGYGDEHGGRYRVRTCGPYHVNEVPESVSPAIIEDLHCQQVARNGNEGATNGDYLPSTSQERPAPKIKTPASVAPEAGKVMLERKIRVGDFLASNCNPSTTGSGESISRYSVHPNLLVEVLHG